MHTCARSAHIVGVLQKSCYKYIQTFVVNKVKQYKTVMAFNSKGTTVLQINCKAGPLNINISDKRENTSYNKQSEIFRGKLMFYASMFQSDCSYYQNVMKDFNFGKDLKSWLGSSLKYRNVDLFTATCHNPKNGFNNSSLQKGYVIAVDENEFDRSFQDKLMNFFETEEIDSNILKINDLDNPGKSLICRISVKDWGVLTEEYPTIIENLQCHPAFLHQETNSIYHNIDKLYRVLNTYNDYPEVEELVNICSEYIDPSISLPLHARHKVIVIEGLDGTGKTTLTQSLRKHLNATILKSPPECICHLRKKFDAHPQLLRRAFYTIGNYAFAEMIRRAAENQIVIADRFWNSTAAYAIATDVNVGGIENLPPKGNYVYSWPLDLLKPDEIFFLTITDAERRKRMEERGDVKTDEEIRLEKSNLFRRRLVESYNRMQNPPMTVIDASGSKDSVLQSTLEILKAKNLI